MESSSLSPSGRPALYAAFTRRGIVPRASQALTFGLSHNRHMDKLRALRYFIAAAQEGSLSGAARRCEVSPPAVLKLIRALERSLGASLFDRSSQGLALTADGSRFLERCGPL